MVDATEKPLVGRWLRSLGFMTIATTIANALSLALSLILSRGLSPAAYGGIASILAISVVGTIPAQAEQFLAARRRAAGNQRGITARAWMVGLMVALGLLVMAPVLAGSLSVTWTDIALLGLNLLPLTVLGVHLGLLLGAGKDVRFGLVLVAATGTRVAAALIALAFDGSVTMFLALAAAAAWLTLGLASLATRGWVDRTWEGPGRHWRLYGVALSTIAGIYVLTSIDAVAGRMLLGDADSGVFAVSTLWARVAFWLPQAVALVAFPVVAAGQGGRRLLAGALSLVAGCGIALTIVGLLLGENIISVTSGTEYLGAARYIPGQIAVGTLGAILQLLTLYSLAGARRRVEHLVWAVCAAEILALAVVRPSSATGIISVEVCVQIAGAIAAITFEWRHLGSLKNGRRVGD